MKGCWTIALLLTGLSLSGCTSDPNATVNQLPPIRQMDHFFNSLAEPAAPAYSAVPDYTHMPGYAPAYPAY